MNKVLYYNENENLITLTYVKPSYTKIPNSIYELFNKLKKSINSNKFNKLYMVGVRYFYINKYTQRIYLADVQAGLTETSNNISENNQNALSRVLSEEIQIRSNNSKILLAQTKKATKRRKAQNWYIMKLKKNEYTHFTSFPPKAKSNKGVGLIIIGTINDLKNILFDYNPNYSTDNIAYPVLININQMLNEKNDWFTDYAENNPENRSIKNFVNIENRNNNNELLSEITNYALQGTKMNAEEYKKEVQKLQNNKNANNLLKNITNYALKGAEENAFSSKSSRESEPLRRNIFNYKNKYF